MRASKRPPVTHRRASSSSAGPAVWASLAPGLAVLVFYGATVSFGFVWDDLDLIVRNAALHGTQWVALLGQDFWQVTGGGTGMWRPLVVASYRLDHVLGGGSPAGFHAVNVLVHALASVLVARLARARGLPPIAGFVAGMLYATAPALSESTAWIAGRTDGFVALFTLLALLSARRWRARGEPWVLVAGGLAVAAALLSKETALMLPLLLAADAADARSTTGSATGSATAWLGNAAQLPLLLAVAITAAWALAHRMIVASPSHPPDPGALLGAAALLWTNLLWLLPWAPHAPLLPLWQPPGPLMAGVAWGALVLVVVAIARAASRRVPFVLPVALVFAPLLPVAAASLLESGVRFAERALVLPVAGVALLLATLLARSPVAKRGLAVAILGFVVALQCVAVIPAIAAWRDDESRIRRVAEVRPQDADALLGMADLLSALGRTAEAAEWIARAEQVAPADADVLVARASLAFRAGDPAAALGAATRALALAPDDVAAGMIRVRSLVALGRAAEALPIAEALAAAHPREPAAEGAYGIALAAAGQSAAAAPRLADASARLLDDAGLAWESGRLEVARGDIAAAQVAFERAVTAEPGFYEAWLGLADTRMRGADSAGADQALRRAEALPGADDRRAARLRAHWAESSGAKSLPGAHAGR